MEMTRSAGEVARILRGVLAGEVPRVHHLQGILDAHGWPDLDEVRANALALERVAQYNVTFDIDEYSQPGCRCHCGKPCITPEALAQHRHDAHNTTTTRSTT